MVGRKTAVGKLWCERCLRKRNGRRAAGNGNGTFQPPMSYSSGAFTGSSIAVGDVNGDNHLDLAVAGGSGPNGYVSVLIGNGDATFRSPVTYSSGSNNGPGVLS